MILRRLTTAVACVPGIEVSSRMTPSTRTRTKSRRCCGVKWMSEAPSIERRRDRRVDEDDRRACRGCRSRTLAVSSLSWASLTNSSTRSRWRVVQHRDRRARSSPATATQMRIGHADREPQLVGEHDVGRIGDRDEHGAVVEEADRQRPVAAGQALGQKQRGRRCRSTRSRDRRTRARAARRGRARSSLGVDEALRRAESRRGAGPVGAFWIASACSSCSGVTAPSRTSSVPSAGHWFRGFLIASICSSYRQRGLRWLRDALLERGAGPPSVGHCRRASRRPAGQQCERHGRRRRSSARSGTGCSCCSASRRTTRPRRQTASPARSHGSGSSSRRREVRSLRARYGRRDPRRQPVHAARRRVEGQPARLLGRRAARGRETARTSGSALPFPATASRSQTGVFGARMSVELVNDGPVTIVLG